MTDLLAASMRIAGSGLEAQSARIRVVAENLANAQSSASSPGASPYRRKTISFHQALDQFFKVRSQSAIRQSLEECTGSASDIEPLSRFLL